MELVDTQDLKSCDPKTVVRVQFPPGALREMFFTYILYSEKFNRFYVGHTSDIEKRLERHNKGMVPSTKVYKPWIVVHIEEFSTKSKAAARELEIKNKKSRHYIESLFKKQTGNTSRF